MNRDLMIKRVRSRDKPWDLIVVGGGATGAGCCLDAAARGLDVLLLEQSDFGKGTSSRSTKLVHGGVRYLEQGNISLVREALRERGLLRKNAPQDVDIQEFIVPCYSTREKLYYGLGLKFYDLLSGKLSFGKSSVLSKTETLRLLPNLVSTDIEGSVRYFDGRFDDTRLLFSVLRTSASRGATVLNYAAVRGFLRNTDKTIAGVKFECTETGEVFEAQAKAVINATGAFSDGLRKASNPDAEPILSCSQGVHLVFEKELLGSETALMIPKTNDGRVLFAIPFYGRTLVGTTDTPIDAPELEPLALEEEIDFILETCAQCFEKPPQREDIKSVFAGIRPLVADDKTKNTAKLSRGHTIEVDDCGLVTITGGKWTTFRNMAEDAVDKAAAEAGLKASKSITADLRLNGFEEFDATGLEQKISDEFKWTAADVVSATRFDMARTVEDVLARRTRMLFLDAKEAVKAAPFVAAFMASELGRGSDWIEKQIAAFNKIAAGYLPETISDTPEDQSQQQAASQG